MNKLWLVQRTDGFFYDAYFAFVCAAPTEEQARNMHPVMEGILWSEKENEDKWLKSFGTWVDDKSKLAVTYLGEADLGLLKSIICVDSKF